MKASIGPHLAVYGIANVFQNGTRNDIANPL
jgi:hypothetical protein